MNLLIVSDACTNKKYKEICNMRKRSSLDPESKLFRLLIEGFENRNDIVVTVISSLPVSKSSVKRKYFPYQKERYGSNITYEYLALLNGIFLRHISSFIGTIRITWKWCKKSSKIPGSTVIVDGLLLPIAVPARMIARIFGIKVAVIVTDIPTLSTYMKRGNKKSIKSRLIQIYERISDKDLKKYDYYFPLTESINKRVNIHQKPYLIIEGVADYKDVEFCGSHKKYIMYAGGLYEKYGVKNLVTAFAKLGFDDIELWLFGGGDYVEELKNICKSNSKIKYFGFRTPDEIVSVEKEALLLVNPRPVREEFSRYSFPSKTMEYLLSGTAVISTRLPGIPEEYFDYLYHFENDTVEGIYQTLYSILKKPQEELLERGKKGRQFILDYKSNKVVANKIINFINVNGRNS